MLPSVNMMSLKSLQEEYSSYGRDPIGILRDDLKKLLLIIRETRDQSTPAPGRPSHPYLSANARVFQHVQFRAAHIESLHRVGDYINVDGFGNCVFG